MLSSSREHSPPPYLNTLLPIKTSRNNLPHAFPVYPHPPPVSPLLLILLFSPLFIALFASFLLSSLQWVSFHLAYFLISLVDSSRIQSYKTERFLGWVSFAPAAVVPGAPCYAKTSPRFILLYDRRLQFSAPDFVSVFLTTAEIVSFPYPPDFFLWICPDSRDSLELCDLAPMFGTLPRLTQLCPECIIFLPSFSNPVSS